MGRVHIQLKQFVHDAYSSSVTVGNADNTRMLLFFQILYMGDTSYKCMALL